MTIVRDKLFIGGRWRAAASGHAAQVVNPATEEVYAQVAAASAADAEAAISAARTAFDTGPWPRTGRGVWSGVVRREPYGVASVITPYHAPFFLAAFKLAPALDHVKVGDPADPTVTMGPLISAPQRDKVETLIRSGLAEGAQLASGGGRPAHLDKGFFIGPTVFVNVENTMTIAHGSSSGRSRS